MTRARQVQEEQAVHITACVNERGWGASVARDNSIRLADNLTTEQLQLRDQDLEDCAQQFPVEKGDQDADYWRVKYQHALDTRECLIAQGQSISRPPSENVWVDQATSGGETLWTPFQDVVDQLVEGTLHLSASEYFGLYSACPQDGPFAGISFD